ncbi:hypothetical protein ACFFSW_08825 [Saccharothrix longispora]|uniref:Uncharacterized protein n=1 Tax=Saccharothrix longispora TaxID=33920 RepID=A0ABU1Q7A3_9PSEU|nr:hypothetical protein [Saccharothrix longispora]MDR6598744.1 hypothetical protein [Saccharothrix longispora]
MLTRRLRKLGQPLERLEEVGPVGEDLTGLDVAGPAAHPRGSGHGA